MRTGGDEFIIVMLGNCTGQEIEDIREMIKSRLDEAFQKEEIFQDLSASVGAAHSDKGKEDFDLLVGEADALMYYEKEKEKEKRKSRR